MIRAPMKIGQTLSQRALSVRLGLDVSTIRKRGDYVQGFAGDDKVAWREAWKALRHLSGFRRLYGYSLEKSER